MTDDRGGSSGSMADQRQPRTDPGPPAPDDLSNAILDREPSLCPSCESPAEALIIERDGRILLHSLCPDHPGIERLLFSDARLYRKLDEWNRRIFGPETAPGNTAPKDEHDDKTPLLAVIDLTNRCNFTCPVCFAGNTADRTYFLDVETVRRMLRAVVEREPVPCRHVQFSGGEPTMHPQFLEILGMARTMGFTHVQVATNGSLFANLDFTRRCEDAGLHTLYLQFDGMDDVVYMALRGQRLLERKCRIVANVTKTDLRLVLVPTVVSGVNVDQLGPVFRFAIEHSRHVTGISVQPMAATGKIEIDQSAHAAFNLADMAIEFGRQTGLTRFPEDWFPLNALSLLTRGVSRVRGAASLNPACDAQCSVGTYFYVDENNRATCLTRFLDLDRFLNGVGNISPSQALGGVGRRVSGLIELRRLSSSFDKREAPAGLTFNRLLRGLDGWEDKSVGRGSRWFRRGFNGMFVAGMHFMDANNYSYRRVRRCIIKYVTTDGQVVAFCRYNAGERYRSVEESARLAQCNLGGH